MAATRVMKLVRNVYSSDVGIPIDPPAGSSTTGKLDVSQNTWSVQITRLVVDRRRDKILYVVMFLFV